MIPLLKPKLPSAHDILPYLEKIDANRWYTNRGPLATLLESRLATFFHRNSNQVIVVNNATSALTAGLMALKTPHKPYCLVPSWTFAASVQAILMAGMIPYFIDVDEEGCLNLEQCYKIAKEHSSIGAAMVVMPFGAPISYDAWYRFQEVTGIPVLVDGAAGFASIIEATLPTVISLHATKIVGIGEGGFILSNDPILMEKIWSLIGFGFLKGERIASGMGFNGKLSEYAAAVGHAVMDSVDVSLARYHALAALYYEALASFPALSFQKGFGQTWVGNTFVMYLPSGIVASDFSAYCHTEHVETRCLWPLPCHLQKAFQAYPKGDLTTTLTFFKRTICLPFYVDLTEFEILEVAACVGDFLQKNEMPVKRFGTFS